MIAGAEAARSLYGAYRLARLDPHGLDLIDTTPGGALRSFWAAVILLPFYALVVLIGPTGAADPAEISVPIDRALLVEAVFYVIRWTAYPVLMTYAVHLFDRPERLPDFIAAYNWSNVIGFLVLVPPQLLILIGMPLEGIVGAVSLVLWFLVLGYQWFVTRTALNVGGGMAAGLVMVDLSLSLFIDNLSRGLLQAGAPVAGG